MPTIPGSWLKPAAKERGGKIPAGKLLALRTSSMVGWRYHHRRHVLPSPYKSATEGQEPSVRWRAIPWAPGCRPSGKNDPWQPVLLSTEGRKTRKNVPEKGILLQEPERASHKQQEQQTMWKAARPLGPSRDHHSFPRFTSAHAFGCKNEVGQEEKRGPDSGSG